MRWDSKPEAIFFIGITGGSCAGKSTFARRLRDELGSEYCSILCQDSYYHDQSARFDYEGGAVNFDDPASVDFELLHRHLLQLQSGQPINVPIYDFTTHTRLAETIHLFPTDIILVEGALILTQPKIVELLTESIFLDAPEAVRLERRLYRDIVDRGRTREGVMCQFNNHVKPMHDRYIEPSRSLATYQVHSEDSISHAIAELIEKLGVDS
jgi:uridine kinase